MGEKRPLPVDHVFVVLLENQPFDRLFADFPGADGDRNQPHITRDRPWWVPPFEPTHGTPSWRLRALWAHRFFKGKYGPAEYPLWWQWARDFVLFDRHRTQAGPSTPNHMTLFAAASHGLWNNPKSNRLLRAFQHLVGGLPTDMEPPFDGPTVPGRLEAAGISWFNYGDIDFADMNGLRDPRAPLGARNSGPTDQFFTDAAAGRLPQVAWIYPEESREQGGPQAQDWTARVVAAIRDSPQNLWERSAILLTWDDWGGFHDHVEPRAGEAPEGFVQGGRVPLLVISPYARGGTVVHEPTIHPSIPAFIEAVFGLDPVCGLDAGANPLLSAFDPHRRPAPAPVTEVSAAQVGALERWVLDSNPAPPRPLLRRLRDRRQLVRAAHQRGLA